MINKYNLDFDKISIYEILDYLKKHPNSNLLKDIAIYHTKNIEKYKHLNAVIEEKNFNYKDCLGENKIFMGVKDNFFIINRVTTAGSRVLKNFIAPDTATILNRLSYMFSYPIKTNMDEFAMGSDGLYSAYGKSLSPWRIGKYYLSPGGSSSGSAISVSTNMCMAAIASSTGGSVTQPAYRCGIVGYKPTTLSRYGLIPYTDNLDVPGFFTRTVADSQLLLKIAMGKDSKDHTSADIPDTISHKKRIAFYIPSDSTECFKNTTHILKENIRLGKLMPDFKIDDIELDMLSLSIPIYYAITAVGAATNLVRYNHNVLYNNDQSVNAINLLGSEAKNRILTGFYLMKNKMELYNKSYRIISDLNNKFNTIFEKYDAVILPTVMKHVTIEEAIAGSNIKHYKSDRFTVTNNLIGMPTINIPINLCKHKLPISLQLISKPMNDFSLLSIGIAIDNYFKFFELYGNSHSADKLT